MNKDRIIIFRMSKKEYSTLIEKKEKSKHKTVSDFIRNIIINGEINVIDLDIIVNRNYQIAKIGNNINQIAKVANTNNDFFYEDFKNLIKEFEKLIQENKKVNEIIMNIVGE